MLAIGRTSVLSLAMLMFLASTLPIGAQDAALQLEKGDHICLVGNALGERMQHHNYFETLLYQQFPEHELVVRNLCFPGDEPYERIRSENFGDPDQHLEHSGATVILYFFGFNESFDGEEGLDEFGKQMTQLVEETKGKDFSGQGAPRVVLVSPIAFENTERPHLPEGTEHNARLSRYADALKQVAQSTGVGYADIFTPTRDLFDISDRQLTLNGAHLNDEGYRALAPILANALFGAGQSTGFDQTLHEAIADKSFHWWHRYRAVNGYSIYGTRGSAGSDGTYNNTDVMERERSILDQMCANRDSRIWDLAQGNDVPDEIDDSNTLPFINPKTNVGGENDPNRERGKLGSLDYLPAEEQRELFKLPDGYEINLVASEEEFPELANPVALNFDNQGRLWVSTMPSYPHWQPKTEMSDKLLILEDHDNDGRTDECIVFADGLHQPTGFEIGNGGAYVAQQPDILFIKDTDGDDRADSVVRQLVGFCSADSHHGIAAFEWGPGGGLYFQEGTFKFSQIESPYGLTRLHEAGVWRYEPRTEDFGVHVSMAFANPWGHVFDRWGQNFVADASPGFSYWAAPISGHIEYPLKHPGGSQWGRVSRTLGGDSNYRFPTFYPKRTRPSAGCELISSSHFPDDVQGNFLLTNCIGDRSILNHSISDEGSGFVGEEVEPLLFCEDGNFRPIDIQFAPDGSLYIVDWHNALIGHLQHNLREPNRDHSHGRIWRITYPSRPLIDPPQIADAPISDLLELLKAKEDRTRYRTRRELAERDSEEVIAAVQEWTQSLDASDEEYEHHMLEALWMHQTHNAIDEGLLHRMLESENFRARAAATRVLSYWIHDIDSANEWIAERVNDPHPRVRLEAVRAISQLKGDEAFEMALGVLEHEMDDYLQYTLDETLRAIEQ